VKRVLAIIASITVAILLVPAVLYAQNKPDASGLQVSPTRSEVTIKPGGSDSISITIKNITDVAIVAKAEVDDFQPDNDTGTPQLLTNLTEPTATSIKPFLSAIADIRLAKGETRKISIPIRVPRDQSAGGYFGVVRFKAFPVNPNQNNSGKQVSLTASVGHILLVQVPGKLTTKLEAVNLSAEYHRNPSNFFVHKPDSMRLEVKNVGNSFIQPFGNVVVKNSKGQQVYSYEVNATTPRGNVLPKSTRVFHDALKNISSFGHYTAIASIAYGNGGDVLTLKTSFWVLPLWLLILVGLVVLLLAVVILLLFRRLRHGSRGFKRSHS
jgi:hypothetical protein